MKVLRNFIVGSLSTLGVSQTLLATELPAYTSNSLTGCLNTIISILGGVISTIIVAYLQHRWRMMEDDRKYRREHQVSTNHNHKLFTHH